MALRRRFLLCCAILLIAANFAVSLPLQTEASTGRVAVFFRGICRSNRPLACNASEAATASLSAQGVTVITVPQTSEGCLAGERPNTQGREIVFIAFSGGSCALLQTVQGMSQQDLQKVKSVVGLEASPNGFNAAVQIVRQANPSVEVQTFNGSQFGVGHDQIPGSPGFATALAGIVGGEGPGPGFIMMPPPQPYVPTGYAGYNPYGSGLNNLFGSGQPYSGAGAYPGFGSGFPGSAYPSTASLAGYSNPTTYSSISMPPPFVPVTTALSNTSGSVSTSLNTNTNLNSNTSASVAVTSGSSLTDNGATFSSSTTNEVKVSYSSSTPQGIPDATSLNAIIENILAQVRVIIFKLAQLFGVKR